MNLRNLVLTVALVSAACTLPNTTSQLPCKTVGATTAECPTGQTCGSDKLCREIVLTCPDPLTQRQCGGNCVDITKDPFNCGGCGTTCAAGEQCILDSQNNPKCKTYCAPNQTACAQSAGGFICENLSNDRTNCGTCGNTCITGQVCTPPAGNPNGAGTCQIQCSGGLTNRSRNCYDTNIENLACGACNNACTPGTHCSAGKCVIVCTPGQTECPAGSGNCVDLTKDRTNCGGCGVACASGQICTSSACQISCHSGLTLCGSSCVNTVADANNYGGCGLFC